MIVTAIGPQKAERDSGIMASTAASAVRITGRARRTVASTIAVRRFDLASSFILLDLIDQNNGVAHDHAGERDHAEQRDETERRVENREPTAAPIMPSGAVENTSANREKLCNCIISNSSINNAMIGNKA